ncbi:HDL522Wp [Eremothecium sinecaudum]|uniref:HDL522Wp n=1 Tax=Eremothecium sinecaudum TaxID=45286 RepID=A0A109UYR2_9SACH|nr:HDL522Wp [Eremothecium sinecaudum]AMD20222.1 HDL522Wp [Eremothecium sinecaudum]
MQLIQEPLEKDSCNTMENLLCTPKKHVLTDDVGTLPPLNRLPKLQSKYPIHNTETEISCHVSPSKPSKVERRISIQFLDNLVIVVPCLDCFRNNKKRNRKECSSGAANRIQK